MSIVIDGSFGEGGGQIVRTSLAMSVLTGETVRIEQIRAGRKKPGLLRQHLCAVRAAAEICGGRARGAELGARVVELEPGPVKGGEYRFVVGSAGSAMLVLQTVLPPLMLADAPSQLVLEGGTHNPMSPPFDFLEQVYLPLLARMGPKVEMKLERPGFYPAGGGQVTVNISPASQLASLTLEDAGPAELSAKALASHLPQHVVERELTEIRSLLGLSEEQVIHDYDRRAKGPGNVLMVKVERPELNEMFCAFGERGLSAEKVAERAATEVNSYLGFGVPVGEHLADQLLLPMAIGAGGSFRTVPLSDHTRTNMEVLQRFIDVEFQTASLDGGGVRLEVWGARLPK